MALAHEVIFGAEAPRSRSSTRRGCWFGSGITAGGE